MRRWFVLEMVGVAALASGIAYAQTAGSRVQTWLVDPHGAVDGVLLRDGRAIPIPHAVARTVTLSVRLHDPVHIDVVDGQRWLVNERDGSRVGLTPPAPDGRGGGPTGVPALQRMTARGHVTAFLRMPEGHVTGFLLATGEQVRVPESLGPRLAAIRVGDMVTVDGLGTRSPWGVGLAALSVTDGRGNVILQR